MALEGFDTVLSYKSGGQYVPLAGISDTGGPERQGKQAATTRR